MRFYTECKGVKHGFSPPFFSVSRLFPRENGSIGHNLFSTLQLKELEKTVRQRKMRKLTPTLYVNGCKLKIQGVNQCKLKIPGVILHPFTSRIFSAHCFTLRIVSLHQFTPAYTGLHQGFTVYNGLHLLTPAYTPLHKVFF